VHFVDSGLGTALLGITAARLAARDVAALTEFGHLVETFAVNEIVKQAAWSEAPTSFSHFRAASGHEVDIVCAAPDGTVVGVEIKATATPTARDLDGLRFLRDRLGPTFRGGVLLSFGPYAYSAEERLHVLPLDRLWQ
jgi:predicted AAA+ superfamily ATPase